MAETLGSLVDKLAIKNLREFHIRKPNKVRRRVIKFQKASLVSEINEFLARVVKTRVVATDAKLKLYNKSGISKIGKVKSISSGIDKLIRKNIELWYLEDEARCTDVGYAFIGRVKKRIDKANQERNDLIDIIDCLLKKEVCGAT